MKCNSLLLNITINRASCLSNIYTHCVAWISDWRTLRIRYAGNDCAKRSLTAAANDTWQARFVWLQFIFHAFNGHTKRREPDTAQHWRSSSSVDCTAAACTWCYWMPLCREKSRAEAAFHITTIFYAQLSGFLCICGAAYVKNYIANPSLARVRENEMEKRVQSKCLPGTWLCYSFQPVGVHKSNSNKATIGITIKERL